MRRLQRPTESDVHRRWTRAGEVIQRAESERKRDQKLVPLCAAIGFAVGLLLGYGLWGMA